MAFNIQPWAWEYLRKNDRLLMVTEAEAQQLEEHRHGDGDP